MNRPAWLQDDLKMIRQWWSVRIGAINAVLQGVGIVVAYVSPGVLFREILGKYFMFFILGLTLCGIGSQFYRQNKLRKTEPDKADAMLQQDAVK